MDNKIAKYAQCVSSINTYRGLVVGASRAFLFLTGYSKEEIEGKSVPEVFKLLRLRLDPNDIGDDEPNKYNYLFTKNLEPREVCIKLIQDDNTGASNLIFSEKPQSRLEEKQAYMQQLYMDNLFGIAVFSVPDLMLLKGNEEFIKVILTCYNVADVIGKRAEEFIIGWNKSKIGKILLEVLSTGKAFQEKEFVSHNPFTGETEYHDLTLVPLKEDGYYKYLVVMLNNMTDKVEHRLQLEGQTKIIKQERDKLDAIIENMSDSVFIFDKDSNYIKINKSAREKYPNLFKPRSKDDYDSQLEFYDGNWTFISCEDIPSRRIIRGEVFTDMRINIKLPDKTLITLNISGTPIYDSDGSFLYGILCCRDITEHERNQELIRTQKDQLQAIIENMSDGLYVIDRNGRVELLNHAMKERVNLVEDQESKGDQTRHIKYHTTDGREVPFDETPGSQVLKGNTIKAVRLVMKHSGKVEHVSISGSPIYDNNGNVSKAVLCMRDITEQVRQDEMLLKIEKEKNEALEKVLKIKDEFLYTITHEFKTPLNVIHSAIQMLDYFCKSELSGRAMGYINKIRQNTFRQLRLVNNLLDVTRIETGNYKIEKKNHDIVYLTRSITESVVPYASQKGLNIRFHTSLKRKIIAMDDEKFERILLNLLSNAIKFTPEGKSICVGVLEEGKNIAITVADEGIGIPEDKREIIFERFGQVDSSLSRQAEGTGIGLSLVKLLVQELGGQISVDSRLGCGSTFKASFPAYRVVRKATGEIQKTVVNDNRLINAVAVEFSDIYM